MTTRTPIGHGLARQVKDPFRILQCHGGLGEVAGRRRVWVGGSSDPGRADFAFGATVEYRGIQISISTGGASPALCRLLERRLRTALRDIIDPAKVPTLPGRRTM